MRLFIGIKPDNTIRGKIKAYGARLTTKGKLASLDNIHQTLVFLGNHEPAGVFRFIQIMDKVCRDYTPYVQELGPADSFRRKNKAMFYVGVNPLASPVCALQKSLMAWIIDADIDIDNSAYIPHITVGRGLDYDDIMEEVKGTKVPSGAFLTRGITLFHSTRVDDVLTYVPLYKSFFGGIAKGTVDRIEAEYAIVEIDDRTVHIPKDEIVNIPKEGDKLSISREINIIGHKETKVDLFEELWK